MGYTSHYIIYSTTWVFSSFAPLSLFIFSSSIDFNFFSSFRKLLTFGFSDDGGGGACVAVGGAIANTDRSISGAPAL